MHRFKLSWKTCKCDTIDVSPKSKNHLEIESKSENTTQKTHRLSSSDSFSPHLPMSMRINSLNSVSMFTRTGPAQIDGPYREMTLIWWLPSLSLEENIKRKRATVKLSLKNSKEHHTICACNMTQNTTKPSVTKLKRLFPSKPATIAKGVCFGTSLSCANSVNSMYCPPQLVVCPSWFLTSIAAWP